MQPITLQDIINKKLNTCGISPDELITDAYAAEAETEKDLFDTKKLVEAYIAGKVAIEANKACGITVPNLELSILSLKKALHFDSDQEIADYYMEHLDK